MRDYSNWPPDGDGSLMREAIRKTNAEMFPSDVAGGIYDHLLTADDWHEVKKWEPGSENYEMTRQSLVKWRLGVTP